MTSSCLCLSHGDVIMILFLFLSVVLLPPPPLALAQSETLTTPLPVVCWGYSTSGALVPIPFSETFLQVSVGSGTACAIRAGDRRARCWGTIDPGNKTAIAHTSFAWHSLSLGSNAACGVDNISRNVRCFGAQSNPILGGTSESLDQVDLSFDFACGLTSVNHSAVCWGDGAYGQLDYPTGPNDYDFTGIAVSEKQGCVRYPNQTAFCWGDDAPALDPNATYLQVCGGNNYTCALAETGLTTCFGDPVVSSNVPADEFRFITCGRWHACGLMNNGSVRCWGEFSWGQLIVPANYTTIDAGEDITCGLWLTGPYPSPSPSPSPSRLPLPSSVFLPSSSASPYSSASPSSIPRVVPLPAEVKASFSEVEPDVTLSSNVTTSNSGGEQVSVRSRLGDVRTGNSTLSFSNYSVTNTTEADLITYSYSAEFEGQVEVEQTYNFQTKGESSYSFADLNFTVASGAVKWSLNLSVADGMGADGLAVRYRLTTKQPVTRSKRSSATVIIERGDYPKPNMTTYFLPHSSSIVGTVISVVVFDVALIDGSYQMIEHDILPLSNQSTDGEIDYELELRFPPFNRTLFYDPNLSMGTILGQGSSSGSSTDVGLIVGVVVAVSGAIILVLTVLVVAVIITFYRRRRNIAKRSSVNYDDDL